MLIKELKIKLKKLKHRMMMRSPSDKWITPDKFNTKKQRTKIKKELKQNND